MEEQIKPIELPKAEEFLQGKDGIKPHHYNAKQLQEFVVDFEAVPLNSKAATSLVEIGDVMQKPEWAKAHNAAHDALVAAKNMVAENPAPDLAVHSDSVESIFKSRAPSSDTVKTIASKHPELDKALQPFAKYLEEFGGFVTGWARLMPASMRPRDGDSITPSQHRLQRQEAIAALQAANPEIVIRECGDPNCTIEHDTANTAAAEPNIPSASRGGYGGGYSSSDDGGCGSNCGHDHSSSSLHSTSSTSSYTGGDLHYHGDTPCTQTHANEPHLPKTESKVGLWVAGIVAAIGVGAYLINEYGKKSELKKEPQKGDKQTEQDKSASWKQRATASSKPEARTL